MQMRYVNILLLLVFSVVLASCKRDASKSVEANPADPKTVEVADHSVTLLGHAHEAAEAMKKTVGSWKFTRTDTGQHFEDEVEFRRIRDDYFVCQFQKGLSTTIYRIFPNGQIIACETAIASGPSMTVMRSNVSTQNSIHWVYDDRSGRTIDWLIGSDLIELRIDNKPDVHATYKKINRENHRPHQ